MIEGFLLNHCFNEKMAVSKSPYNAGKFSYENNISTFTLRKKILKNILNTQIV